MFNLRESLMSRLNKDNEDSLADWWHFEVMSRIPYWIRHPVSTLKDIKRIREFPPGTLVEDCRYHPCVVHHNYNGDIECVSLISGGFSSCSLFHCGVVKISRERALEMYAAYQRGGNAELLKLCGYEDSENEDSNEVL